ncbi:hypothetical protein KIN20_020954 [Parelaphostrongylus tenuis]|uniref:Uncharacterized protein n=1 Tax=Parelaphostrongylus tenuis TaxID=148309 RepID=A0AAD5N3S0_PARTN|nr:hypothetical protein KIN20_020954 [Parelaphostrongylus tenuis]
MDNNYRPNDPQHTAHETAWTIGQTTPCGRWTTTTMNAGQQHRVDDETTTTGVQWPYTTA